MVDMEMVHMDMVDMDIVDMDMVDMDMNMVDMDMDMVDMVHMDMVDMDMVEGGGWVSIYNIIVQTWWLIWTLSKKHPILNLGSPYPNHPKKKI